jgi:oligopeptide/dipeptide ABC transporter ATP-binding protein
VSLLEVDGVTHRYASTGTLPVLDRVNLALPEAGVLAVVGESGCGKTTLGKLVAGALPPTQGVIRFDGRNIATLEGDERKQWRRQVQLVHQDPYSSLNPGVNISSTLGPPLLHHKLAGRRELTNRLLELLQQVGLDATPDFLRRFPHQLSGGQRQRVAIARAMSLGPRLVVADEVTSMLDVSLRVAILDLLLSFRRERDVSYLFISHDFGVVRYFARGGRIIVMFYGVVVEEGPTEEVISRPAHPYTWGLREAIPVPDPALATEEAGQAGGVMRGEEQPAPSGCIFSNRCPFVEKKCRTARPPLVEVRESGHRAACFFPERVPEVSRLRGRSANGEATRGANAGEAGSGDADPGAPGSLRRALRGQPGR